MYLDRPSEGSPSYWCLRMLQEVGVRLIGHLDLVCVSTLSVGCHSLMYPDTRLLLSSHSLTFTAVGVQVPQQKINIPNHIFIVVAMVTAPTAAAVFGYTNQLSVISSVWIPCAVEDRYQSHTHKIKSDREPKKPQSVGKCCKEDKKMRQAPVSRLSLCDDRSQSEQAMMIP